MSGDEDERLEETAAFSVVTLRNLVARSAHDPEERPSPPPESPRVLSKGAAVLVFPEPTPAPVPPVHPTPLVGLPRRGEHVPRARRRETTPWTWMKRRLLALALLALAVMSQPWWWNVGDVRVHAASSQHAGRAIR